MNVDQASCGVGCSGNPYDANWAFDPIGHGDIHELGHGLEKERFRFAGWDFHAPTNPYAYYVKSKYNSETGSKVACQALPFKSMFNILQASRSQSDPQAYVKEMLWSASKWAHQMGMMTQLMMTVQGEKKIGNGWHVLPRLHIIDRAFVKARASEEAWLAQRDNLGFGQYAWADAKVINNNDWLLIALSFVSTLDFRDYLALWSLPFSQKAADQVASFAFPIAPLRFYMSPDDGYCVANRNGDFLAKASVPLDGLRAWPAEVDTDTDGYWDALDNCPVNANSAQADLDQDGIGDVCDNDSDGDGLLNVYEIGGDPGNPHDTDQDGLADYLDADDDNDGVPTAAEQADPNGDGNPDDAVDANNNGIADHLETTDSMNNMARFQIKAMLQGPYQATAGLMDDSLRRLRLLPSTQPYNRKPFYYAGTESIAPALLAIDGEHAIVDWVLVDVRRSVAPYPVIARKAVLMQRNGSLVDAATADGVLAFSDLPAGDYRLAIRHRNHLGVMTKNPVTLPAATTVNLDFTNGDTLAYGQHGRLSAGTTGLLWSGDVNGDRSVIVSGPGNDNTLIFSEVLLSPLNEGFNANYSLKGYSDSDLNLDGYTIFTGPKNEQNILFGNSLLHPGNATLSTNYTIKAQLPSDAD